MFVCPLCTCIGLHLVAHAPYSFGTSLGDFVTCPPGCGSLTVSSGCHGQCKNAAQYSKDPEKNNPKVVWFWVLFFFDRFIGFCVFFCYEAALYCARKEHKKA